MTDLALYWIDPDSPPDNFPPISTALSQPDGLLCFGGDLSPERLICAYERGIFPWYTAGQPIMWWSPSPRCVIYPRELTVRRSLKKKIRNAGFEFSLDMAFADVITACAKSRGDEEGTWITEEILDAYVLLHKLGFAHSAEIWKDDQLVGGAYGIALGRIFFGESMFSIQADASKVALSCLTQHLIRHDFQLLDAQVTSAHILSLGAREIDRATFSSMLDKYCHMAHDSDIWQTGRVSVKEFYFQNE